MAPAIRPARSDDDLTPLLYESASRSYDVFFGSPERAVQKLRALVRQGGHISGWDACRVVVHEGQLVGVLAGCSAADHDALARRTYLYAFGQCAPWRWPAMLRVIRQDSGLLDPPDGSWYVDALAVAPAARRRGVARALLADAEDLARRAGCSALSLDTAVGNVAARALYVSAGMVAGPPVRGSEQLGAIGGAWVPYVKAL